MAWTKAKTAVVVGVGLLVAGGGTTIAVKKLQAHRLEDRASPPPAWRLGPPEAINLVRPPSRVWSVPGNHSSSAGLEQNLEILGLDGSKSNRIIFKTDVSEAALQRMQRQSALAAKSPDGQLPVLILIMTRRNAPGLKANSSSAPGSCDFRAGCWVGVNQPLSSLVPLLEEYCGVNITDGTENGRYDFELQWSGPHDPQHRNIDGLKEALRDQLGLELMPGNSKVQVLINQPAPR